VILRYNFFLFGDDMRLYFFVILILVLSACSDSDERRDSSSHLIQLTDSSLYGKWVYVDSGEEIELLSNSFVDIQKITDNQIKQIKDGSAYYLIRASLPNVRVNGDIDSTIAVNRAVRYGGGLGGIGGLDVVLANIHDEKIQGTAQTNDDGSFTVTDIPSGEYNLTITSGEGIEVETKVLLEDPVEDLGRYKLTASGIDNFKSELILDQEYLYADSKVYSGVVRFHNISETQNAVGLQYEFNTTDGAVHQQGAFGQVIAAKSFIDIPFTCSFDPINTIKENVPVNVLIKDYAGNSWSDTLYYTSVQRGGLYQHLDLQCTA